MTKYKLTNCDTILRDDGASIPMCDGNRDYDEYKLWVAEGNTPDPADPEPEQTVQPTDKERIEALESALLALLYQ